MRATSDAQSLPNLEIQDVEAWPNEFSIDMPTAAEMAERGKTIAEAPWPSIERVVEPCEVRGVEDRLANIFKP